jgi:shikimate dehydrogenase
LAAFAAQAPDWRANAGTVIVLGAGGAARGAVAALLEEGAPEVLVSNRTLKTAESLAAAMGPKVSALLPSQLGEALKATTAVINATSAGLDGRGELDIPLALTPETTVVMDMVYKPLETALLRQARALGRPTVDGLEMLLGQARPAFHLFFGQAPPLDLDVRALALKALTP